MAHIDSIEREVREALVTWRFSRAFEFVIKNEGSDVIVSLDDPCVVRKYGISSSDYPDHDIPRLTLEDARAILCTDYWTRPRISCIGNTYMAIKTFDFAVSVNSARTAITWLQRTLQSLGEACEVTGALDANTFHALNNAEDLPTLAGLMELAVDYYARERQEKRRFDFNDRLKRGFAMPGESGERHAG